MRVHFHGAAGEVTGSLHEVEAARHRVLLDCGMIQGSPEAELRNLDPFAFEAAALDALMISHAHIDHIGRVPLLLQRGFRGAIHAQAATADLMRIMLPDSASIAESEAERGNRKRRHGEAELVPLESTASPNALHPIKSFDQLKQQPGKEYSGDVLWAKSAEAAKKNTEKQAVGCFVAGTLVHTREGLRPIEQIKVGDYVLSKPESGNGETAYKRVVNTFEFEDKETWFVSWALLSPSFDSSLKISQEQRLEFHRQRVEELGQSFAVTTPNHPFWVVASDEESLQWEELPADLGPPYPRQQWVRADRLLAGMTLLLADGRLAGVMESRRVYKTDEASRGWINSQSENGGGPGLAIDFSNQKIQPCVPIHAWMLKLNPRERYIYEGHVDNANESYIYDTPSEPYPESWYRSKVYNLEVDDHHTYFVDKLGVWVHN